MQKKLIQGLLFVLLANLLVKPLWILGIEVGVQNTVGNEMYGFYIGVFNLSYILNILLDLGITNYNTRNIARNPHLVQKYLSGILGLKLILMVVYAAVAFAVGAMLGYTSDKFTLLAWLCVAQGLNSLILYLRSNYEGLMLFGWDSLFSVLDRLLMIAICGCMLWTPLREGFTIRWFVYAQVASYAITAAAALILIARKTKLGRLRIDGKFLLVVLKQSAPFALLVLLMASYNRIDPILLSRMADEAEAGRYAAAFRLLDALTMVAYLVSVPLLPVYSRVCKEDRQQLVPITRIVFAPMMLFAVGVALLLALLAEPTMNLLYHGNGSAYVPVFRVVIFGLIPISITYIFGTLLTAGGHLRQLNIFAATSLMLNIVVNIALIPRHGAVGSAWASLSAQTFIAVAQLILALRLFHLPAKAFAPPHPKMIIQAITNTIKQKTE